MKQFLTSYAAACEYLKRDTKYPDVSQYSAKKQQRLNADHELETLLEANNMIANDGKPWEADLADTTQEKWYPWFDIEPITDQAPEEGPAGFRLSFYGCLCDRSAALIGARHACKNREVAAFMGKSCPTLYKLTLG